MQFWSWIKSNGVNSLGVFRSESMLLENWTFTLAHFTLQQPNFSHRGGGGGRAESGWPFIHTYIRPAAAAASTMLSAAGSSGSLMLRRWEPVSPSAGSSGALQSGSTGSRMMQLSGGWRTPGWCLVCWWLVMTVMMPHLQWQAVCFLFCLK